MKVLASDSITHGSILGAEALAGEAMADGAGTTLGDGTDGAGVEASAGVGTTGAMVVIMADGAGTIGAGEAIMPGAHLMPMDMAIIRDMR